MERVRWSLQSYSAVLLPHCSLDALLRPANCIDAPSMCVLMQGMCDGPPPEEFTLTEPLPTGACAVRVREDFLDAPIGTTCLLIDSLYMLVAPGGDVVTSSTLILHVRHLPKPCIKLESVHKFSHFPQHFIVANHLPSTVQRTHSMSNNINYQLPLRRCPQQCACAPMHL